MSDRMTCIPFEQLLDWILSEHQKENSVFGVRNPYKANAGKQSRIFDRKLETVIGPAAGPNSQLTQNIVAAYYAGARFFELKTVQKMDGPELAACVNKPCIKADDEGYNCEWSTELYVEDALDEYIKAWFLLHIISKEFGLGSVDGFQFNISVGYDLEGIKTPKIDNFIESMKEAKDTKIFKHCQEYLLDHVETFKNITKEDIENIPSDICNSVTISTLHGCPPKEIESIADYLILEKNMNTFVKCNPTLLGYDFARETMDAMGYDYLAFGRFHFEDDLQYEDAVPMLQRLMKLAEEHKLSFGVKLTNTFPVDVKANELPSEEMYMSGKSLYALSISLAAKLSKDFDGKLRIAYSGGADALNIEKIAGCGIWPITVATTILKAGGYQRLKQMAEILEKADTESWNGIDVEALETLAKKAVQDKHHQKAAKGIPSRKSKEDVPLLNCFTAPCEDACPIHQDVSTYMKLAREGKYEEAFQVILDKNPLPFITGTICAHRCMSHCTRVFYESPVNIRETKLQCAQKGSKAVLEQLVPEEKINHKTAVVGGGPAGMAAAFYLARAGVEVTIFEKESRLGGLVHQVIPDFRIKETTIDRDVKLLEKLGVQVQYHAEIKSVDELKEKGFDDVILAVGAYKPGNLEVKGANVVNALSFLKEFNQTGGSMAPGEHIVVVGGGNTAMDTARAAIRCEGVKQVYLVYRRTKRYMPADEQELLLAMEDGVQFMELLAPEYAEDAKLICRKMVLGKMDASQRPEVIATHEFVEVPADLIVAAVGEKVPSQFYEEMGIALNDRKRPLVQDTLESSVANVYIIGDGLGGPATVVEGIANAKKAAESILGKEVSSDCRQKADEAYCKAHKGILVEEAEISEKTEVSERAEVSDANRCLGCSTVCENCTDVCPNRANVAINVPDMDMPQIVHVDYMCNECGNCNSFCPYASAPYKAKFTLFANETDMNDSTNQGFVVLDKEKKRCLVRFMGATKEIILSDCDLPQGICKLMDAVIMDYTYLIP